MIPAKDITLNNSSITRGPVMHWLQDLLLGGLNIHKGKLGI